MNIKCVSVYVGACVYRLWLNHLTGILGMCLLSTSKCHQKTALNANVNYNDYLLSRYLCSVFTLCIHVYFSQDRNVKYEKDSLGQFPPNRKCIPGRGRGLC